MTEYLYALYNPGQYPEHMDAINDMARKGWTAHTVLPNYNEIYIFWSREGSSEPVVSGGETRTEPGSEVIARGARGEAKRDQTGAGAQEEAQSPSG